MWLAGEKTKKLVEKVEKLQGYSPDRSLIEEAKEKYRKAPEVLLSDFMKKEYKGLVQAFVGKAYQEDFYHIIDRINRFPYARGLYRRTVRANVYLPFLEEAFTLMLDYRTLDFYGGSLEKYIKNDLSLELLDMKNVTGRSTERARFSHLDYMIAADAYMQKNYPTWLKKALSFIPDFIGQIPILQAGIPAILSIYFDLFSGFVQALVFCLLTMVYVSGASPAPEELPETRRAILEKRAARKLGRAKSN